MFTSYGEWAPGVAGAHWVTGNDEEGKCAAVVDTRAVAREQEERGYAGRRDGADGASSRMRLEQYSHRGVRGKEGYQ